MNTRVCEREGEEKGEKVYAGVSVCKIKFDRRVRAVGWRNDTLHELGGGGTRTGITRGEKGYDATPVFPVIVAARFCALVWCMGRLLYFYSHLALPQECMNGDITRVEKKNLRARRLLDK